MIYLDNAATTMKKPPEVIQAVTDAMTHFGGVGRGAHDAAMDAGLSVFRTRQLIAELFHTEDSARVAFFPNITYALNAAIEGLYEPGMSLITTACAHNSVLRPLYRIAKRVDSEVVITPHDKTGHLIWDEYERMVREADPGLLVLTHASNVTGEIYPLADMIRVGHEQGHIVIVDAAQSAGIVDIDMPVLGIDVLCFTGHKSLYGPQGTGGMVCAPDVAPRSFAVGGSGVKSYDQIHPTEMPTCMEAGTLNAHGIAGLAAGVRYVQGFAHVDLDEGWIPREEEFADATTKGTEAVGTYVRLLRSEFLCRFHQQYRFRLLTRDDSMTSGERSEIPAGYEFAAPQVCVVGTYNEWYPWKYSRAGLEKVILDAQKPEEPGDAFSEGLNDEELGEWLVEELGKERDLEEETKDQNNTGIVALSFPGIDAALVADVLASEYGIATRAGAHCAPLMHKSLGTDAFGALRLSFSTFNTAEEMEQAARALAEILDEWDMSDVPEEDWLDVRAFRSVAYFGE